MTNAIITALKNGTADASHSGLVTPTGIESQVQIAVARFENDTGKRMHPQFSDLGRGNRSDDGAFIFLNECYIKKCNFFFSKICCQFHNCAFVLY